MDQLIIEQYDELFVIRDDMQYPKGGSKMRAADELKLIVGTKMPVFSGTSLGAGSIAMALIFGARLTVFLQSTTGGDYVVREIISAGSAVQQISGSIEEVQCQARHFVNRQNNAFGYQKYMLIEFGMANARIIDAISRKLADQMLASFVPEIMPDILVMACGSCTMLRAVYRAMIRAYPKGPHPMMYLIRVGIRLWDDLITPPDGWLGKRPIVIDYNRKFHEPAKMLPMFPSFENYDAKAFETAKKLSEIYRAKKNVYMLNCASKYL